MYNCISKGNVGMKAIIHYNDDKDIDLKKTREIADKLLNKGVDVLFDCPTLNYKTATESDYKSADVLIVLGGDGTVLGQSKTAAKYNLPVFGINIGNLGFLTSCDYKNADKNKNQNYNAQRNYRNNICNLLFLMFSKHKNHLSLLFFARRCLHIYQTPNKLVVIFASSFAPGTN